jgi:Xaa-Pro aminopeptidase
MSEPTSARLIAGIPSQSNALFHRIRFMAGDPAAWITLPDGSETLLIRDIEADRARRDARVETVCTPADYEPEMGLSGDRETATAQAVAECIHRSGAARVVVDRSTPHVFIHQLGQVGLQVIYDEDFGVLERRSKDAAELDALRRAQAATEQVMEMACRTIGGADVDADGVLVHAGEPLTSERVRILIDVMLLELGYDNSGSIVAGGPAGADCHFAGAGPLRTGEPVIVDIFPRSKSSRYNGDCTRTVVNGRVSPELERMHAVVREAKAAGIASIRAGVSGESVHRATIDVITGNGYPTGMPPSDAGDDFIGMVHGTGHGVGLDVHEPPLLDFKGPALVVGDVLTVEPGLYGPSIGGIRIEDMVAVTEDGCENFNALPEGLDWT